MHFFFFFCRVCNVSDGDKCRDGRDGDAGCGWLSKSDDYLHRCRIVRRSYNPAEILDLC